MHAQVEVVDRNKDEIAECGKQIEALECLLGIDAVKIYQPSAQTAQGYT